MAFSDGDSHVRRVTNAFTVLSVRLFGDIDLDGGGEQDSEWAVEQCVDAEAK